MSILMLIGLGVLGVAGFIILLLRRKPRG